MALVTATQAAKIAAAYPKFAAIASQAQQGDLKTETVTVMTPVSTVRKNRKVILPGGQVLSIDE